MFNDYNDLRQDNKFYNVLPIKGVKKRKKTEKTETRPKLFIQEFNDFCGSNRKD